VPAPCCLPRPLTPDHLPKGRWSGVSWSRPRIRAPQFGRLYDAPWQVVWRGGRSGHSSSHGNPAEH
jgi:hypothetical protein